MSVRGGCWYSVYREVSHLRAYVLYYEIRNSGACVLRIRYVRHVQAYYTPKHIHVRSQWCHTRRFSYATTKEIISGNEWMRIVSQRKT
eukprot:6213299-Pleurochrysis_carterae.AAC.1